MVTFEGSYHHFSEDVYPPAYDPGLRIYRDEV